jgi:hypothetical protein
VKRSTVFISGPPVTLADSQPFCSTVTPPIGGEAGVLLALQPNSKYAVSSAPSAVLTTRPRYCVSM